MSLEKVINSIVTKVNFNYLLSGYAVVFLISTLIVLTPYYLNHVILVPLPLLIFREILFASCLIFLIWTQVEKKFIIFFGIVSLVLLLQLLFISDLNKLVIFGFRSLIPLVFLFALPKKARPNLDSAFILSLVKILFFLNFICQLGNFFLGKGIYGKFAFDLNARNPGIFLYPAASAFFILMLFYIYLKSKMKVSMLGLLAFLTSLILCASLTGISGACVLLLMEYKKFTKKTFITAVGMIIFGIFYFHAARMSLINHDYLLFKTEDKVVAEIPVNPVANKNISVEIVTPTVAV